MRNEVWHSLPKLLVSLALAILLFRGPALDWAVLAVAVGWLLWLGYRAFALNRWRIRKWLQGKKRGRKLNKLRAKRVAFEQMAAESAEREESMGVLLLYHVGHRITDYLTAAYPKATWSWCAQDPVTVVAHAGTVRIELHNVPDYNFAELTFDRMANIKFTMLKAVALEKAQAEREEDDGAAPAPLPGPDPQAWFELQGRGPLEQVVADLNSRGFDQLLIKEDGEAVAGRDNEPQLKFSNFPARQYWPGLVKVMDEAGLKAGEATEGLVVAWNK